MPNSIDVAYTIFLWIIKKERLNQIFTIFFSHELMVEMYPIQISWYLANGGHSPPLQMGFSWDLADTMIKANIQFSKKHKNHILPGNLNRIRRNTDYWQESDDWDFKIWAQILPPT